MESIVWSILALFTVTHVSIDTHIFSHLPPLFVLLTNRRSVPQVAALLKMMKVLHQQKMRERHHTMRQRVELHKKQSEKLEAKRDAKHKAVKKQIYRVLGQVEKRKSKRRGGDD